MISNVVGASVDDAAIGDRVEVGFEDRGSYCLPVFHLA
jgi:hypothetical protein